MAPTRIISNGKCYRMFISIALIFCLKTSIYLTLLPTYFSDIFIIALVSECTVNYTCRIKCSNCNVSAEKPI